MATGIVDIDQVQPDIDPMEVGIVKNPLAEEFTHPYGGKPLTVPAMVVEEREEIVGEGEKAKKVMKKVKVEGRKQFPLYVAVHLAKHLAEKIIRAEFRAGVLAIKDEKKRELESAKPIPDYKGKVWEKMKELVETESTFFEEKGLGSDGEKEKFIK